MSTIEPQVDVVVPDATASKRSSGRMWPVMIFSLLSMNAGIVGVTLYFALSDKSAATEPDYYAQAIDHDATMRRRAASLRLGWKAMATLRRRPMGRRSSSRSAWWIGRGGRSRGRTSPRRHSPTRGPGIGSNCRSRG